MNYIILCDTTYQILSAISFRLGHTSDCDRVDLLVDTLRTSNVDMEALALKVREHNVFTNVYCFKNYQGKYKSIVSIIKVAEWVMPRIIYKLMTKNIKNDCKYDTVVVSGPFSTQRCLIAAYPRSNVCFIEDGLGSYIGRSGIKELSWRGKIAQRIFKYSPIHIYPKSLYLYSPGFYDGEYRLITKKLLFPKDRIELLDCIFSIKESVIKKLYRNYRFIYFSQLLSANDKGMQVESILINAIKNKFKDDFIVRPHPRGERAIYDGLNIDDSYNQWELCCTEINDRSVLISSWSTALFVPKLIYDLEPVVIFTYKIYGNNYVEEAVKRLKEAYSHKERVICVTSIEELVSNIADLKKDQDDE